MKTPCVIGDHNLVSRRIRRYRKTDACQPAQWQLELLYRSAKLVHDGVKRRAGVGGIDANELRHRIIRLQVGKARVRATHICQQHPIRFRQFGHYGTLRLLPPHRVKKGEDERDSERTEIKPLSGVETDTCRVDKAALR